MKSSLLFLVAGITIGGISAMETREYLNNPISREQTFLLDDVSSFLNHYSGINYTLPFQLARESLAPFTTKSSDASKLVERIEAIQEDMGKINNPGVYQPVYKKLSKEVSLISAREGKHLDLLVYDILFGLLSIACVGYGAYLFRNKDKDV